MADKTEGQAIREAWSEVNLRNELEEMQAENKRLRNALEQVLVKLKFLMVIVG